MINLFQEITNFAPINRQAHEKAALPICVKTE
jgi:hypothetical protein